MSISAIKLRIARLGWVLVWLGMPGAARGLPEDLRWGLKYVEATPEDDIYAAILAAPNDTVVALGDGVFKLQRPEPYNHGIWIGNKSGLRITGNG